MKRNYFLVPVAVLGCVFFYFWTVPDTPPPQVSPTRIAPAEDSLPRNAQAQVESLDDQVPLRPAMEPPLQKMPEVNRDSRRITAEASDYLAIANPVERMLTATSERDSEWMARNRWPTIDEVMALVPSRDCVPQDEFDPIVEADLKRANACVARFFSDQDPRFEDAVLSATSRGSSLASNLEFEHELSKPASNRNTGLLADLALQSAILGDYTALEYAIREQWDPLPLRRVHIVMSRTMPIREIFVRREAAFNAGMRPPRPRGFAAPGPVGP